MLENDPSKVCDLTLAADLISGRIQQHETIYAMIRLLGQKADKVSRGHILRQNVSSLPGVNDEVVAEVGFQLASSMKSRSSMGKFGYGAGKGKDRKKSGHSNHPGLPNFLLSHINHPSTALQRAAQLCLQRLQIWNTRNGYVIFDDTVFVEGFPSASSGYLGESLYSCRWPSVEWCSAIIDAHFTLCLNVLTHTSCISRRTAIIPKHVSQN